MALPEWPPQMRDKLPPEMWQWWQAFKSWIGAWSNADGSIGAIKMLDGIAPNNSIYFSLTSNKLAYKDSAGTVHALY